MYKNMSTIHMLWKIIKESKTTVSFVSINLYNKVTSLWSLTTLLATCTRETNEMAYINNQNCANYGCKNINILQW